MVSADNLHLDILTEIFSFVSLTDLASASLVSKSFNAGAISRLYYAIHFRASDLKKWPTVTSPFTTILARSELSKYVKSCEITALPPNNHSLFSDFMKTCIDSLLICENIHTLILTVQHPAWIQILREKNHLHKLHLQFQNINLPDTNILGQMTGLQSLILCQAPLSVCQQLPRWIPNVSTTLRALTINETRYLDENLLIDIAKHVSSHLRSFHINNCLSIPHMFVLRAAAHLPLLESLGFSIGIYQGSDSAFPKFDFPNLHHVRLSINAELWNSQNDLSLLGRFFDSISKSPIISLTCQLNHPNTFPADAVSRIILHFGSSLQKLNFIRAEIHGRTLANIIQSCKNLTQLTITLQRTGVTGSIVPSLMRSPSLKTLVILSPTIPRAPTCSALGFTRMEIRDLFRIMPGLKCVVVDNQCWLRDYNSTNSSGDPVLRVASMKHLHLT